MFKKNSSLQKTKKKNLSKIKKIINVLLQADSFGGQKARLAPGKNHYNNLPPVQDVTVIREVRSR
jgi:hypothetical protein